MVYYSHCIGVCLVLVALTPVVHMTFTTATRSFGTVSFSGKSQNFAYPNATTVAGCVMEQYNLTATQMDCTRACAQNINCTSLSYEPSMNVCRLVQGVYSAGNPTSVNNASCLSVNYLMGGSSSSAFVFDVISIAWRIFRLSHIDHPHIWVGLYHCYSMSKSRRKYLYEHLKRKYNTYFLHDVCDVFDVSFVA